MNFITLCVFLYPIITEVMLDPLGPETGSLSPGDRNEFIEIYNPSDDTLDMALYKLKDDAEEDSIVPFNELATLAPTAKATTKIPPHSYGVIFDREYVIEGENYMPYNLPDGLVVMTTKDTDLGNGLSANDTIRILDRSGRAVSSFGMGLGFPISSKDGFSFERKYYQGEDEASNWRYSEDPSGNTCGRLNSVSHPYSIKVKKIQPIKQDTKVSFAFEVLNEGTETIRGICISYTVDILTGTINRNILLYPDSSCTVESDTLNMFPGYYTGYFEITLPDDPTLTPIRDSLNFFVRKSPLIINEIMYDGDVEWIEIYNRGDKEVTLMGFCVKDPKTTSSPVTEDLVLAPDSYLVLSAKPINVENCYTLSRFPTLNNTGDTVMLVSSSGEVFDSVPYSSKWGGGYNISLERISADVESYRDFNWTTSREGSTPGRKNSVSYHIPSSSSIVSFSKRVISSSRGIPFILVNLQFPTYPVYATVELFRIDGIKVGTLLKEELLRDGRYVFSLSKTLNGRELEEGMYLLIIKGKTTKGDILVKRELIGIMN